MEAYNSLASIAITFGLLVATLWAFRRFPASGSIASLFRVSSSSTRRLRSIEKLALAPDCALHLIEVEGQLHLFAVGNKCLQLISLGAENRGSIKVTGQAA